MPGTPSPKIHIELQDGLLSVQVEYAMLADVLDLIGAHADFNLILYGSFQMPITQSFSNVSLENGIRRLVRDHSVAITYKTVITPKSRGIQQDTITGVWVFETNGPPITTGFEDHDQVKTRKPQGQMTAEDSSPSQQPERIETKDLSRFSEDSDVGYWVRVLGQSQDQDIREKAITTLKWIGSDTAVRAIATSLGDPAPELRRHAVESIGSITSDLTTPLLGQVLIGDPNVDVRAVAVRLFAERLDEPSRAFLNTALEDKDMRIRELAKQTLDSYNP